MNPYTNFFCVYSENVPFMNHFYNEITKSSDLEVYTKLYSNDIKSK